MKLRSKFSLFYNVCMVAMAVLLFFLSFNISKSGYETCFEQKATGDLSQMHQLLDYECPGEYEVKDDGFYKGEVKLDENNDLVDGLSKISGDNITIFNGDTRIATTFSENGKRMTGTKAASNVIDTVIKGGKNYIGVANILGKNYVSAYMPIKTSDGKIVGMLFVGITKSEIEAVQRRFIIYFWAITVILIVISFFGINRFCKRTFTPLEKAQDLLDKMSKGDLKSNDLAVPKGKDEIVSITKSANSLKNSLNQLMRSISESAQQVAASSEELTASASETADSINSVAQSVVKMAEGAGEQNKLVDDVLDVRQDSIEAMNGFESVSESIKDSVGTTADDTAAGQEAVNNATTSMKNMKAQIAKVAAVVDRLGQKSNEIGQIISTISDIASQTNLLSLNASIEAARAGEAGRGFAVVAEEIGQLAEQSGKAASDISDIIGGIQNDTNDAIAAMNVSSKAVEESTEIVEKAGAAFEKISSSVNELRNNIDSLYASMQQLAAKSNEMTEPLNSTKDKATLVSDESQTVSASTQEQAAVMGEISNAAASLAEMAQSLQKSIAQFEV